MSLIRFFEEKLHAFIFFLPAELDANVLKFTADSAIQFNALLYDHMSWLPKVINIY